MTGHPHSVDVTACADGDRERTAAVLGCCRLHVATSSDSARFWGCSDDCSTRGCRRAPGALMHRGPFREALAWLEIHGETPEAVEHWRGFIEASGVRRSRARGHRRPPTAAVAAGGGGESFRPAAN